MALINMPSATFSSRFYDITLFELKRQKAFLPIRAPGEAADQPAHHAIRSSLGAFGIAIETNCLHVDIEDSYQTAPMHRLI